MIAGGSPPADRPRLDIRVGCDNSGGNSGGPAWRRARRTCPSGSTNQSAPNHSLGHDDWLFNFQNDLRSTYP